MQLFTISIPQALTHIHALIKTCNTEIILAERSFPFYKLKFIKNY